MRLGMREELDGKGIRYGIDYAENVKSKKEGEGAEGESSEEGEKAEGEEADKAEEADKTDTAEAPAAETDK